MKLLVMGNKFLIFVFSQVTLAFFIEVLWKPSNEGKTVYIVVSTHRYMLTDKKY